MEPRQLRLPGFTRLWGWVPLRRQGPRRGLELQRKSAHVTAMKAGYVYIMASRRNGTLYIGVTSDLVKRAWEHRNGVAPGFTRKYGCKLLVWYAAYDDLQE